MSEHAFASSRRRPASSSECSDGSADKLTLLIFHGRDQHCGYNIKGLQLRSAVVKVGYEAWVDSGVAFNQLSGSDRVGVYVGTFGADALGIFTADPAQITGYEMAGAEPSMFPSR